MRALKKWLAATRQWFQVLLLPDPFHHNGIDELLRSMLNRTTKTNFQTLTTFTWDDVEITVIVIPSNKLKIQTQRTVH